MKTFLKTTLFIFGLLFAGQAFAQMDVCATKREPRCSPACETECSYQECDVHTQTFPEEFLKNLPLFFPIPQPNCASVPGNRSTVEVNYVPFTLSGLGLGWSTSAIPHPVVQLHTPICRTEVVMGGACPTMPPTTTPSGSCPAGMTEITSGTNAGKCASECHPVSHLVTISNMDGSGSFTESCAGECDMTCANFVNCHYKNMCTGTITMGSCAIGGSHTLGCGASVATARCNDTTVTTSSGTETTVKCIFWSVNNTSPPTDSDFSAPVPSPEACGTPTTTTTTTTTTTSSTTTTTLLTCPAGQTNVGGVCSADCVLASPLIQCTQSCANGSSGQQVYRVTTPAVGNGTCAYTDMQAVGSTCNVWPSCGGGGGGGGCFVGGTQISMADGSSKSIELVKVGDLVITMDEESGENVISPVIETYHHAPKLEKIYDFKMANGASLVSNNIHPIFVVEKQAYYKAEQIYLMYMIGERISFLDANNVSIEVKTIEHSEKYTSVYNFEVRGMNKNSTLLGAYGQGHNYFAEGFLVHNALYSKNLLKLIFFNWLGESSYAVESATHKF